MDKRTVASLLLCVVTLLTVAPSKALAQTSEQTAAARSEPLRGVARANPNSDLKTLFAERAAKNSAGGVSAADLKRLEKGWLDPQNTPRQSSGFSTREKVLMVVILVAITAVAIVLVHNGFEPGPDCDNDPFADGCIR